MRCCHLVLSDSHEVFELFDIQCDCCKVLFGSNEDYYRCIECTNAHDEAAADDDSKPEFNVCATCMSIGPMATYIKQLNTQQTELEQERSLKELGQSVPTDLVKRCDQHRKQPIQSHLPPTHDVLRHHMDWISGEIHPDAWKNDHRSAAVKARSRALPLTRNVTASPGRMDLTSSPLPASRLSPNQAMDTDIEQIDTTHQMMQVLAELEQNATRTQLAQVTALKQGLYKVFNNAVSSRRAAPAREPA